MQKDFILFSQGQYVSTVTPTKKTQLKNKLFLLDYRLCLSECASTHDIASISLHQSTQLALITSISVTFLSESLCVPLDIVCLIMFFSRSHTQIALIVLQSYCSCLTLLHCIYIDTHTCSHIVKFTCLLTSNRKKILSF